MKDLKSKAKKAMLEKLRQEMGKMGADNMMGGMGVEVQADDKEGLLEGLEKAEEVIEDSDEMEEEADEYGEMSRDELIAMIKNQD